MFELFVTKGSRLATHRLHLTVYHNDNPADLLNNINDLLASGDTSAAIMVVGMVAEGLESVSTVGGMCECAD